MKSEKQVNTTLRFLTSIGNANILWHHILALEEDIINKGEDREQDITYTPHFAAWIRMLSEYISNSLFDSYYQMNLTEDIYNYSFDKILFSIELEHINNPAYLIKSGSKLQDVIALVKAFVDLRHCFQHGGLPNIGRSLKYTTPETINEILNPQNFHSTREMFLKALSFTLSLPKQSVGV